MSSLLGSLRRPLTGAGSREFELVPAGQVSAELLGYLEPQIEIVKSRWREYVLGIGLVVALVVPSLTVIVVVAGEWVSSPSQRGWLVLGFGFYIIAALKSLWTMLLEVVEQAFYLRVEIRRMLCPTLYESVTNALSVKAEQYGATCSLDQEAVQEYHPVTGDLSVKLRFWSSQARIVEISLNNILQHHHQKGEQVKVRVRYSPGEDVVCGRDSRVERREILSLSMRTSPNKALAHKALLCRWLEQCYTTFVQQDEGVVKIHALQESSTDWVPTWAFERLKPCKSASATGQHFFLERGTLHTILADAKLWSSTALRVYLITGAPGVGKSEFAIWLAGQLALPVYRLCLSSPKLTDDRISQLLSQSSITHDSVLVQVDEFQETVQRWVESKASNSSAASGVTAGGFCECLQGSTAMGRGVVVLTGTQEIVDERVKQLLPAVFRRIHREAHLGWMTEQDVRLFFRQFLARFVPDCSPEEWNHWEQEFVREGPWGGTKPISVDMLKQFLMHSITEASCSHLGEFAPDLAKQTGASVSEEFRIRKEKESEFFGLVCSASKAHSFLEAYAPVNGHINVISHAEFQCGEQE
jgi:hypothetical protein